MAITLAIVASIAYIFWTVFGLIFWIPLLTRVTASFCASLSYNMLVNNAGRIKKSQESVYHAISFYATGFKFIYSTLFEANNSKSVQNDNFQFSLFFGQLIWTLIFWVTIFFSFYPDKFFNFFIVNTNSSQQLVEKAENSLAIHDTTSAIEYYSYAIKKDNFNAEFYNKRGWLYFSLANYRNAVRDFSSVIKLDTSYQRNTQFTRILGWQLLKLEEYNDAIEYYNITIKYKPQYADAYFERGVCYANSGNTELAIRNYDKTLQIDSNFRGAYRNKGLCMIDIKRTNEACLLFDKAIKLGDTESINYKRKYCHQ